VAVATNAVGTVPIETLTRTDTPRQKWSMLPSRQRFPILPPRASIVIDGLLARETPRKWANVPSGPRMFSACWAARARGLVPLKNARPLERRNLDSSLARQRPHALDPLVGHNCRAVPRVERAHPLSDGRTCGFAQPDDTLHHGEQRADPEVFGQRGSAFGVNQPKRTGPAPARLARQPHTLARAIPPDALQTTTTLKPIC
jgi:hypothetical protein